MSMLLTTDIYIQLVQLVRNKWGGGASISTESFHKMTNQIKNKINFPRKSLPEENIEKVSPQFPQNIIQQKRILKI